MAEILERFELRIQSIALHPSDGGRFEVIVDGQLVYSKLETGRHLEEGEIVGLLTSIIESWDGSFERGFCLIPQAPSD